jgi:hypothetical protein
VTTSDGEFAFTGNEEMIEKIKANGTKLPIKFSSTSESNSTTSTGERNDDNSVPVRIVIDRSVNIQSANGQDLNKDNDLLSGIVVEGVYENGVKLRVDSIISDKLDTETKMMLRSVLESVLQNMTFPEKSLGIGDSFDQNIPMSIPSVGGRPINAEISLKYTLKKVKRGIAYFEIEQSLTMDMGMDQANITVTGGGMGMAEYVIDSHMLTNFESDLAMKMHMSMGELMMDGSFKVKSIQSITVK